MTNLYDFKFAVKVTKWIKNRIEKETNFKVGIHSKNDHDNVGQLAIYVLGEKFNNYTKRNEAESIIDITVCYINPDAESVDQMEWYGYESNPGDILVFTGKREVPSYKTNIDDSDFINGIVKLTIKAAKEKGIVDI